MRGFVPGYTMVAPESLDAALDLVANHGYRPFAGGTDLMVLFNAGKLAAQRFVSLWDLAPLRGIEVSDTHVRLGALTTYSQVQRHVALAEEFPSLVHAAALSGAVAIQNRGTLGGNIANASPAADSPPALLAYQADIELISVRGTRRVDYSLFHTGYKTMALEPDELVISLHLPRQADRVHYYRKVGTRRAQAISKVCMAAAARRVDGALRDVRIALGSVAPTVCVCRRTQEFLEGRRPGEGGREVLEEARRLLASDIAPIDDIRSTRDYRARVAGNLLEEFWTNLRESPPSA